MFFVENYVMHSVWSSSLTGRERKLEKKEKEKESDEGKEKGKGEREDERWIENKKKKREFKKWSKREKREKKSTSCLSNLHLAVLKKGSFSEEEGLLLQASRLYEQLFTYTSTVQELFFLLRIHWKS